SGVGGDGYLLLGGVAGVFSAIGPAVPREFIEDRSKLMGGRMDFGAVMKMGPPATEQLRAHASFLELQLSDGRPWLLGSAPSVADFSAYHPVSCVRSVPPVAKALDEFEHP